jgi:hypothetical protein
MLAHRLRASASAPGRRRFTRSFLSAATILAVLASVLVPATAALAAEPAAVRNTKSANATLVHPGDTFNWMVEVGCSVLKDDCVNATLTDVVPDEFILPDPGDILLTPALNPSERTITITGQTVTVAFHQDLLSPAGQKGLTNGTVTVTIPVTVRSDLDYTPVPRTVENTSQMVADNAPMVPSTASVQLEVPLELATQPAKSFSPTSNISVAGLETELSLGGSNTSNAPVTTLAIQDPVDPTVSGNIFRTALALQSLGAVTWPDGATSATVSLWDASLPTPAWIAAAPVAVGGTLVLPAAVDPVDAGGIRIEFSSGTTAEIPRNASASFVLDLANRAGVTVGSYPNVARSTVTRDALSATETTTASYAVTAATSAVSAGKSIAPDRMSTVAFGANDLTSGAVTLTGGNSGSIPLTSLTISEPTNPADLTSANSLAPAHPGGGLIFDGFTGGVAWPAGATGASITYYYSDGSSQTLTATAPGLPAADDTKRVTGFSATFTGTMAHGVQATLPFTIRANPAQAAPNLSQPYSNTIAVTGVDVYNQAVGPATATDTVTVLSEQVNLTTKKTLTRTELRAAPNQSTIATLTTTVAGYPDSTRALDEIVMLDPPTETGLTDWYKYFDASEIVLTQVPGDATLTVSYRDAAGVYHVLDVLPTGTQHYVIPTGVRDSIYGLKLTWKSTTGFQPGQTLVANVAYELRDTLRGTTTPLPDAAATLQNCSSSSGTSVAAPDAILSNVAQSDPCPTVTLVPTEDGDGGGGGAHLLDKRFINTANTNDQTLISTRNDNRTRVRLSWSTDGYSGVGSMTIYDGPVNASGSPAPGSWADKGMFDVFNLVSIPRITASLDPLLTYDHVYAELYNKDTQEWEIPTGWCDKFATDCNGVFPARTLDATQQEKYVAIRFIFTERSGRTGLDPAAGSGVAASLAHNRNIDLVFQLRDSLRSDASSPVVDGYRYNTDLASGHSVILNDAEALAVLSEGGIYVDRASDTIELRDPQLAVGVTKTWAGGSLAIPDSTVTVRPTSRVTITATNQTVGKVDSLTIAEPNPTIATPNDSPFEKFDLLRFQSIAHPAGATGLTVTVTRTAGGPLTATGTPAAVATAVLAWTPSQLADATGVTFVYTGRIDGSSSSSAKVVFDLALREATRTGAAAITAGTVYNSTQAVIADERWDSESSTTSPEFTDAELGALAGANIQLVASTIGVTTSKTFATTSQVEPVRDAIRLTLQATPSGSERVQSLTITDDRATFWNAFDFVALPTSGAQLTLPTFSPAPTGSGTVIQVEACVGGTWDAAAVALAPAADCVTRGGHWEGAGTWKTQAQARTAFLPTGVTAAEVEGLRITIKRADGSQWENPQAPTVSIPLMVQRRVDLRTGDPVRTNLAGNAASPGETVAGRTSNGLRADVVGV